MANAYLLENSHIFVKLKLMWSDRQKEKSLLKLRYDLIQHGFDRKLFRIRDLKLFYYGVEIKDRDAFETIAANLRTISITTEEKQTDWLISSKYLLVNTRGLDTIAKQGKVLDFINVHNLDILLITETWWTENELFFSACPNLLQEVIDKMVLVEVLLFSAGLRVIILQKKLIQMI